VGVNAVTITEATQVVAPPRWSVTVTRPSWPLIVLGLDETAWDPRETLLVGALIESVPAVSVNEVGVSAAAGSATTVASAATLATASKNLCIGIKTSLVRPSADIGLDVVPCSTHRRFGLSA
jgi:hypothetical protein